MMRELVDIQSQLHAYRDFSECVVVGIEWSDYCTTATITVDYTWNSSGHLRADHEQRLFIDLRFKLVQEFTLRNELPASVVADSSLLGWSHNELSVIWVREAPRSSGDDRDRVRFHQALLRREGSPWIEVIFAELEILERAAPAGNS